MYNIKIGARYALLLFFVWLAYDITRPEWVNAVGQLDSTVHSVIYGSVFGALTWIVKSHFETKVGE